MTPSGSGIGWERAREAITLSPRAQRERSILSGASLRAQARSRGEPQHRSPPSQNQSQLTPGTISSMAVNHQHRPASGSRLAQRDRVGASSGSDHPLPSRAAREVDPLRSFLASAGPVPRSVPGTHPRIHAGIPTARLRLRSPGGTATCGIGPLGIQGR